MSNPNPAKPFKKGDPRINRKGRPRDFNGLRELAKLIADEKITSKDGQTVMSRIELIMREWALSRNFQKEQAFVQTAYGKVPDAIDLTSGGKPIQVVGLGINTDEL